MINNHLDTCNTTPREKGNKTMDKIKEIQNKEDFLKWANAVNYSTENKRHGIADLQDTFFRNQDGEMKALRTMFLEANSTEKHLLTFSIIKAMGEETAYRFIKAWAKKQADIVINEYQKDIEEEYQKLANDRMSLLTERKAFEIQAPALQKEIEELKKLLENSRINNDGLHQTISRLEERNRISNNELESLNSYLEKVQTFKKTLREIITPEQLNTL